MAETGYIKVIEDIGQVKVGNTVLPGIYQAMEISREVRMDEGMVSGRSGASKQPLGFEDARIQLTIALVHDDQGSPSQKLRVIAGVFQGQDQLATPFVYTIAHPLMADWGIRKVIFKGLKTYDDNRSDIIMCVLTFVEHEPVTRKKEKRRPKSKVVDMGLSDMTGNLGATVVDVFGQGMTVMGDPLAFNAGADTQVPDPATGAQVAMNLSKMQEAENYFAAIDDDVVG